MQSRGPDVLVVSFADDNNGDDEATTERRIVFGSSIVSTFRFPTWNTLLCYGSCDGLVCIYCFYSPNIVVNPATKWHRSCPLSNLQQFLIDKYDKQECDFPDPKLGFGKDKLKGTFKQVWLYNSSEFGLDNVTTCEVFDFSTNAWRYVHPASPYRINDYQDPVYFDGSLHWLTEGKECKILSFDLHTETFQVICKAPFLCERDPVGDTMCILDNRLCVSEINGSAQLIWSLDSSGGNKTWKKLCSINLTVNIDWFMSFSFPLSPIAILDETKLLLQGRNSLEHRVIYDLHTKSYDLLFDPKTGYAVYYYQSLFSALSNKFVIIFFLPMNLL
ncbi:F-box protein At1g11270 [Arabidopsis lyrata subsp. lyrata]|uniref:F-box protein At1g11270 n=1 Tax=Arabidopsis lyrata subsp. lyrata TaxID=81972 RepID=UPI000A29D530|nr:F-box protein At1g11270 [Arabidopsis lyrata subsp. lyrata]|eukprot:XP_020869015.1 F-box protein At1g11270 [Arabidopsis lyrata subsp. lyrata]